MRFLLVTGMSGAGKTVAIRYLEDLGALCVDNLPPVMMHRFIQACEGTALRSQTAALAVDVRSHELFDAVSVVGLIREAQVQGHRIEVLFLDASDDVLVSRYKESRREHPLAGSDGLTQAIARERELLQPLRETADEVIDTTGVSPKELQQRLQTVFGSDASAPFRVEVTSFGFKRGLPKQADLVYDVRFLPNPFYIEGLGRQTGKDKDVREFVMEHPVTKEFMNKTLQMLDFLLPHYQQEGKRRLVIAVGCTGGAHRSVAIAEAIGSHLRSCGYPADVQHRDIELEQARWKNRAEDA